MKKRTEPKWMVIVGYLAFSLLPFCLLGLILLSEGNDLVWWKMLLTLLLIFVIGFLYVIGRLCTAVSE